jgi:hypothetical protein
MATEASPTNDNITNQRIFWQTIAAIGVLGFMWKRFTTNRGNYGDAREDTEETTTGAVESNSVGTFPWEPSSDSYHIAAAVTNPPSIAQLDILAAMTFANGGIRAPSCLCCR